ncbi:MAG: hypothetical protein ACE5IY_17205 [bacterium]
MKNKSHESGVPSEWDAEPAMSHEMIVAYLSGKLNQDETRQIMAVKEQHAEYDLLLELIDQAKQQLETEAERGDEAFPATLSDLDRLLLRLLAGDPEDGDCAAFVKGLRCSPAFYKNVLLKIRSVTPELVMAEIPEFANIKLKTDDEALAIVIQAVDGAQAQRASARLHAGMWPKVAAFFRRLRDALIRMPRFVQAVPVIVVVLLATFILHVREADRLSGPVYDNIVPHEERNAPVLRGGGSETQGDREYLTLLNAFKQARVEYLAYDYAAAIPLFENVAQDPRIANVNKAKANWTRLARETHFYLGLSYFAYSRTERSTLDRGEIADLTEKAIAHLEVADELAIGQSDRDRETYFLGLTNAVAGNKAAAIGYLNKIGAGSEFKHQSQDMLLRLLED